MKKISFLFFVMLSCTFLAFGQDYFNTSFATETANTESANTYTTQNINKQEDVFHPKSKTFLSVNAKNQFVDTDIYYSLHYEDEWMFSKNFSINSFVNFNINPLPQAAEVFDRVLTETNTWLGKDTILYNFVLLLGIPYIVYTLPVTLYYSQFLLDFGSYINYHPFYNEYFDTKLGLGLSSEPYETFKKYNYGMLFAPMLSAKAEASFNYKLFYASTWVLYKLDILEFVDTLTSTRQFECGISIGLCFK